MPRNIDCIVSNSSVDITWITPESKCKVTGFNVTWRYDNLWNSNLSSTSFKKLEIRESFSIEDAIPYSRYSVQITTLVLQQAGINPAECLAETPPKSMLQSLS